MQLRNFERQVLFLLATPPVYRMNNTKTKNMNYTDTAQTMASKRPKPMYVMNKNLTPKVNFTELG